MKNGAHSKFHDNSSPSHSQVPLTVPTRRRASSPQSSTLDDSSLAQLIFSDGPFSPNQKSTYYRSTSALSDQPPRSAATLPSVHSSSAIATGRHLDFDSSESPNSSFSAYDDFDEVSTPSSLHSASASGVMRGGSGTSKSMGTLRDFDLAEDVMDHAVQGGDARSLHSGASNSRSGYRYHPNAANMGTGRYDHSPTMGLQYGYQHDGLPQSPDRLVQSPDSTGGPSTHYHPQSNVILRGGGTHPRNSKTSLGATHAYSDDGSDHTPLLGPTRIPRPHARTGSDEQFDIQEMLTIWNDSPSNPFEIGGTLV